MAEAAEVEDLTDDHAEEGVAEEPQWSPEEERIAASFGWKPKEQFDPAKGEWRDPKQFIENTRKVIFDSRDKNRALESKLARVVATVAKLGANQRTQADRDAQAALDAAVEAGDLDAARKAAEAMRASQGPSNENPAFTAFKERNEWFGVDDEATAYAAALDSQYAKGGIADPDAHMRKVELGVKRRFPELFGGAEKANDDGKAPAPRTPLVARGGGGDRPRNDGTVTVSTMTREMRSAAEQLGVSPESYVKSWNAMSKKGKAA